MSGKEQAKSVKRHPSETFTEFENFLKRIAPPKPRSSMTGLEKSQEFWMTASKPFRHPVGWVVLWVAADALLAKHHKTDSASVFGGSAPHQRKQSWEMV
ncbi:hypothetical protein KFL_003780020 [Klebsormidium nitens]|uniref:Uncharacterized protein n=1 Tax=Klebsormidium nitens TaxID=105231 RepID=A0A1Y1IGA4_KLENI|nr:hypothetical protein KFL_003780020 [Klebsormidium nitens]|eukprot:GAQ87796.1 hypothetical protein KFL_003780020 [Klebsormidium nitens]